MVVYDQATFKIIPIYYIFKNISFDSCIDKGIICAWQHLAANKDRENRKNEDSININNKLK